MSFVISHRGIGVCGSCMGVVAAHFLRADLLIGLCSERVPNGCTPDVALSAASMAPTDRRGRPRLGLDCSRATFFMFFTSKDKYLLQ